MKKLQLLLIASIATAQVMATDNPVSCNYVSLSGNISANRTLSSDTMYRLDGCVTVTNGTVLTIQAGTTIIARKSNTAGLYIAKGGKLIAIGTSANPIVFTSDQTVNNRAAGDWSGIVLAGKAKNNVTGGTISIDNRTCSISGGDTLSADSSGAMKYVQINYATYGLSLVSVGKKTVVDNVMVSYPANNAFEFLGGNVTAKHLIAFNAKENDFRFDYGNQSLVQFGLGLRLASDAHVAAGANGIVISNDNTGSSHTPNTHPIISNFSFLGPRYCGATSPSTDFKSAVLFQQRAEGGIYNSVLADWNFGMTLAGSTTQDNAGSALLAAYNTFYNNDQTSNDGGSWSSSCASTVNDWLLGSDFCSQAGNEELSSGLGYDGSICTNYNYSSANPSFLMGSNSLSSPDYTSSELSANSAFFTSAASRGAFNTSTDWTATGWAQWNPQGVNYCPGMMRQTSPTNVVNITNDNTELVLAPNPSTGITYAEFTTVQTGSLHITVINSLGQVVRTINTDASVNGKQKVAINTNGLSVGVYSVKVSSPQGSDMHSRLVIQ